MLYPIARTIAWPFLIALFRLRTTGRDRIPATGPVIVVANHSSYLDPILIGMANRREINYMAKAELFDIWGLGWVITKLHAFPVRRNTADRKAIRTALDLLAAGEVLVLFPEGTRFHLEGLGPIQPGAGVIAEKAQCPIVPITLINNDKVFPQGVRFPRFPKLRVIVGDPILPQPVMDGAPEVRRKGMELLNTAMKQIEETKRAWSKPGQGRSRPAGGADGGSDRRVEPAR